MLSIQHIIHQHFFLLLVKILERIDNLVEVLPFNYNKTQQTEYIIEQ